ncbi:Heat shock factor-binding protein 1 [Lemmus lemmus]
MAETDPKTMQDITLVAGVGEGLGKDRDKVGLWCVGSLTVTLDDMSSRIDDLEKNIADLMTQAGVEDLEGENKIPTAQKS